MGIQINDLPYQMLFTNKAEAEEHYQYLLQSAQSGETIDKPKLAERKVRAEGFTTTVWIVSAL